MKIVVLDASVVLKWFLLQGEKGIEKARGYQKDHLEEKLEIVVPELVFYEVGNVLITKPGAEKEDVEEALEILHRLNLKVFQINQSSERIALGLCQKYKISFYDAAYVALAKLLRALMITADQKLYQKLRRENVVLLGSAAA